MTKFRDELITLIDSRLPEGSFAGTVVKVDGDLVSVRPADGGAEYHKVRLRAVIDGKDYGIVFVPVVGSSVIVSALGRKQHGYYVSIWTEASKILIKSKNNATIELLEDSTIELNGKLKGGIPVAKSVTDKLNNLELKVNELIVFAKSHSHPSNGATAPTGAAIVEMVPTIVTEIENQNVKHG